ncbi:uncharacterized protein [Clytia hemisphaerica]|uniref:uncharacterized protein n=1 Tax=Clytia hemisphaerica TaxID=252671 RepID=UPI0034D4B054
MKCQMETLDDGKRSFNITINEYRDWLENQWKAHMELDKKYQIGDVLLMDDIKKVEEFTSTREKKLESIHERMEKQLSLLSTFLEKAAHMRPPSSITSDNSEQP